MTTRYSFAIAGVVLVGFAWATSTFAAASAQSSIALSSTLQKGVVNIQADPTLVNGRLVLKVAAHNSTDQPQQLTSSALRIFIGNDTTPVATLTVDQLIAEARGGPAAERSMNSTHQSSRYSRPTTTTSRSGELDVAGVTGASGAIVQLTPERSNDKSRLKSDPATEAQVEALQAGILQSLIIPPGQAAGAQVVTEKLKFARKEPRMVRLVVSFAGEAHEFEFDAPPAK